MIRIKLSETGAKFQVVWFFEGLRFCVQDAGSHSNGVGSVEPSYRGASDGYCFVKYRQLAVEESHPPDSVIARLADSKYFRAWSRLIGKRPPIIDPENGRTGRKSHRLTMARCIPRQRSNRRQPHEECQLPRPSHPTRGTEQHAPHLQG